MSKIITGGCCCGDVTFTLEDHFSHFYFCHCTQCRKLTGASHAANLFTSPNNINWVTGLDKVKRYDHPTRSFSKAFCVYCGSGVPFVSQSGKALIVPAGSLNEEPSKSLDAQIFCAEQTQWHKVGVEVIKTEGFPP
ncbi:GFA family protein [Marinagarivorans algicola]|uniref:GFA family protein n=1 Tax=Marinagarivorans algicola TaxID=1513270 RepID=UPI0006B55240|nr:GFA family protein [Marinagarivorans algicola]